MYEGVRISGENGVIVELRAGLSKVHPYGVFVAVAEMNNGMQAFFYDEDEDAPMNTTEVPIEMIRGKEVVTMPHPLEDEKKRIADYKSACRSVSSAVSSSHRRSVNIFTACSSAVH